MSLPEQPTVTVIMPIRNEAAFISRSLGAVLAQDYPAHLTEVVVSDGMSDDATRDVIARLAAEHPDVKVTIVDNPGRIVPTGFNRALAVATGDIIVRVDGHTIIAPDYVRSCVELLRETGADNVGGRMDAVAEGQFGRATALATASRFGIGNARFHYYASDAWVDTVYMGAWPRSVFQRVGLFDEEQVRNQDDEFNYRIRERGGKILLSPRIRSRYYNRTTLRSLWKQYFQYGFWKVRVMQKHPRQMSARQFVPPALVATLGLALLLAPVWRMAAMVLTLVGGSYVTANLAASLAIGLEDAPDVAVLLPAVFATLHFSYGCGFVMGLVRFADRWRDRDSRWAPELSLSA